MDNLYREAILDHYKNPLNYGRMKNPTSSFRLYNSACGDELVFDLKIEKDKKGNLIVTNARFEGQGCAVSIASASMLSEKVKGWSVAQIKSLEADDIKSMLGIDPTPTRLKCALLPLETLCRALGPLVKKP